MRYREPGQYERLSNIARQHGIELFGTGFQRIIGATTACVVHQHIQLAVGRYCRGNELLAVRCLFYVAGNGSGVTPSGTYFVGQCF